MENALLAPSWGNTQPWGFTIVAGATLQRIKDESLRLVDQGVDFCPEITMPDSWNEQQSRRYKGLGRDLFAALDIKREDKEKREEHNRRMTLFFDAPCVAYLHLERGFNHYALMDCGLVLQSLELLAVEQGLGTCILARAVRYPQVARKYAPIPEERTLVIGTAIGYPLPDHPANVFRSKRGAPDEFLQWVDVE